MVDGYLGALAKAAEEGAQLPTIRLAAGGFLFQGEPSPSSVLLEAVEREVEGEAAPVRVNLLGKRVEPTEPTTDQTLAKEHLIGWMRFVFTADNHDPATVLTLRPCRVFAASGGGGLEIPVVRISLAAVTAWWILGEKQVSGGTGWFVGAVFPVDD